MPHDCITSPSKNSSLQSSYMEKNFSLQYSYLSQIQYCIMPVIRLRFNIPWSNPSLEYGIIHCNFPLQDFFLSEYTVDIYTFCNISSLHFISFTYSLYRIYSSKDSSFFPVFLSTGFHFFPYITPFDITLLTFPYFPWMRFSWVWMRSSRVWMRSSRLWMRSSQVWMRSSRACMRSSRAWMRCNWDWMRSDRVWTITSACGWDLTECGR